MPMFAMLMPLMLIACGVGIDGAIYLDSRRAVEQAIDISALAMISDFRKRYIEDAAAATMPAAISANKNAAIALFYRNIQQLPRNVSVYFAADISVSGTQFTGTIVYTGTLKPTIISLFGKDKVPVNGSVTVKASALPYIEVTLLIDTSGSMGIGVDSAAQARLKDLTGCVFACHDNEPYFGYKDRFAFARANNVTLRYDAISSALDRLIDKISRLDPSHQHIKTSIWSFDTFFRQTASLSTNMWQLRRAIPTAPATGNDKEGATRFKEGIDEVVEAVGSGGNGANPQSPIKVLILATDGVQDPGRYWVTDLDAREEVDAFDVSFCSTLKSRKVQVGVVHTPYLPLPGEWGFVRTLDLPSKRGGSGNRLADVAPALKECAGGNYHVASDEQSIIDGFQTIFSRSISPRISD